MFGQKNLFSENFGQLKFLKFWYTKIFDQKFFLVSKTFGRQKILSEKISTQQKILVNEIFD